jgi:hypothetical protein
MGFTATWTAFAANSCDGNVEARLSKMEKEIADIKALLGQNPAPVNPPSQTPVACSSINLRTAKLHVKCTTSKGAVFERVSRDNFGEAWRGPDGWVWSDRLGSETQDRAIGLCRNIGAELPLRADFERGEANGFREVLPNMKINFAEERYFWTSSNLPSSDDNAYLFNGGSGIMTDNFLENKEDVRCVER